VKKPKVGYWSWAVVLGLWVIFHFRVIFEGHNFVYMDASNFFYPLWKWGAECLNAGHIPLWNADAALGVPYFADPETLCWYPPKVILYRFFSAGLAFKSLDLAQYLWLLIGFYWLAKKKGCSDWVLLAGCLALGFCFETVALSSWAQSMFFAFTWVPWVFLSAAWLWEGRRGGLFYFSLCLAMQLAAGYPVYAYLTLFSLFIEKFFEEIGNFGPGNKGLVLKLFRLAAGLCLAFFYNLAWILPFIEFIPFSNIAHRLDLSSNLGLQNLGTWLNPFFCGHPLFDHQNTPFSSSVYFMGLPTVVLILWGLARRKIDFALGLLFFLFLGLSLGKTLWMGEWLKSFIPGYRWVARSGYWIPLVCFFAALLVLRAAQGLLEDKRKRGDRWMWVFLSSAVLLLALVLGVPFQLYSFWIGGVFLLLAGLGFVSTPWRGFSLALAFVFSMGPPAQGIHFTLPQAFYDEKPPLIEALSRPGRLFHTPDFLDEYKSVSGQSIGDVYQKFKQALLPNWPLEYGLEETGFNNTIFLMEFLRWYYAPLEAPAGTGPKFINYLNTSYIIGRGNFIDAKKLSVPTSVPVWANLHPLPKWFSVSRALPEKDWASDFKTMADPKFDFSRICFTRDPMAAGNYGPREVYEIDRSANHVGLQAGPGGNGLLVSSELAYPGWEASVNGENRSLEVVNYSFRGVRLKPGDGRVALDYRPVTFRLGAFWSLLAVGIWAALFMNLILSGREHGRPRV
jgi:hypothetical protein